MGKAKYIVKIKCLEVVNTYGINPNKLAKRIIIKIALKIMIFLYLKGLRLFIIS